MERMTCPSCGKEIPSGAIRCDFCGHVQGFGHQKLGDTIKSQDKSDTFQPSQEQTEDIRPVTADQAVVGTGESKKSPAAISGKLKRLNTILTGKTTEPELEVLRREGLLPDAVQQVKTTPAAEGEIRQYETSTKGQSSINLPIWLQETGINADDEHASGINDLQIDNPASKGEIPDWVRKLQEKVQKGDVVFPVDAKAKDRNQQALSPEGTVIATGRKRKTIPNIEIQEPEARLTESVVNYLGGLKTPQKVPADRNQRLSRLIWGVIGLAMFSLAATLLWSGSSIPVLSQPVGASLADMTETIDSLSPESVVLVGVDYDVSLAGELDNAALPVIVHLMNKQVSLVFVSTRPTGSALSAHLIDLGMNWKPEYPRGKAFIFSYLPGEAAGLLQMAINPRQALTSVVDGTKAWQSQNLAAIHDISDFSLIVLLADSTGSGRDWFEQVQPRLDGTPLYAVVSKQAEPIYRPYLDSGQIQAMVAGISDGADYERVYLFTNTNQQMMRAYNGLLLLMTLLLASVVILSVFPQNQKTNSTRSSKKHAPR